MAEVVLSAAFLSEVGISESHMVWTGFTFLTSKHQLLTPKPFQANTTMSDVQKVDILLLQSLGVDGNFLLVWFYS